MTDKTKEALKLALDWIEGNGKYDAAKRIAQTIREALAEESSGTEKPAQQQEPVAFSCLRCVTPKKCAIYGCSPNTWPSETPPAQRKPLTDEQWQAIADTLGCFITRSQKEIIEATIGITGEQK